MFCWYLIECLISNMFEMKNYFNMISIIKSCVQVISATLTFFRKNTSLADR